MPSEKTWQIWLPRLYSLRRDKCRTHERPHKPVLILAILDLLDQGKLHQNQVPFDDALIQTFRRYFDAVRHHDDKPTIENPYYFLSGDGFWTIQKPGDAPLYQVGNASSPPSIGTLRQTAGRFDPQLWQLMQDPASRAQLREALVTRYFPDRRQRISALANPQEVRHDAQINESFEVARSSAFRQTVLELYDFMCAACGMRVRLNDGFSLVDAAHIIPFTESRDDNPSNGLALCPNHHRAMDRFLIAPCPDPQHKAGVWRISSRLDDRKDIRRDLVGLSGRPVMEPSEPMFLPALPSLRWREQHLNVQY